MVVAVATCPISVVLAWCLLFHDLFHEQVLLEFQLELV
jgi:hypothetical protein